MTLDLTLAGASLVANSAKGMTLNHIGIEKARVTAWADNTAIAVTHGADPEWKRSAKVINTATKKQLSLDKVEVANTSDTVTTLTNKTGGVLAAEIQIHLS
jgi:hypothetical protein